MKKIFKYKINLEHEQTIKLPLVKVLDIQKQDDHFCLWAIVDTEAEDVELSVLCVGTGCADLRDDFEYLATTQDSCFVWHWFYKVV